MSLVKRSLDIGISAVSLLLLSPLFAAIAIAIRLEDRGAVFYRQWRMGLDGRPFHILKFRSMVLGAEDESGPTWASPDDPRRTRRGRFLRRWSLDELPQLINVLRGEMSLVGPRPLILDEDENVVGRQRHRLDLLPGITGLWQVLGRS